MSQYTILFPGPRIAVVGVTGAGKTTTSTRLAEILHLPHIELDALHWQPNWTAMETEAFRQVITRRLAQDAWVVDGNYRKARDLIWARATTLIWLDYSLPVILWQLTRRSLLRIISQEELWNGNRENFRGLFLSRESLYLWAFQSYRRFHETYPQLLSSAENAHLQVIRFRSRRDSQAWLAQLAQQTASISGD